MMDEQELANSLFGASRIEATERHSMSTIQGVAVSDSVDGTVKVQINGESIPEEADATEPNTVVELPTTPAVKAGDTVTITCEGGVFKTMTVTGNNGSGDVVAQAADDAAKVATNYIDIDENKGITVGNMTEETLGKNTYIDANGVQIRDGETVLASFEDDEISLGNNSENATINFCNNFGVLGYTSSDGVFISSNTIPDVDFNNSILLNVGNKKYGTMQSSKTSFILSKDNSSCLECKTKIGVKSIYDTKISSTPNNIILSVVEHYADPDESPNKEKTLKITSQGVFIDDGSVTAETVLYSDTTGTQGDVTLRESAENFTYLEIYFGGDTFGSVKVYAPEGKAVELKNEANGAENVVISGTTITRGLDTPAFYIQRVVGIK